MQRFALAVEYDGLAYHGWQRQKHCLGAQQHLEEALEAVACHPVEVTCAGRTDTGVHGIGQIVHFDAQVERPLKAWVGGVNRHLPSSLSVHWAVPVSSEFHARYGATGRSYRYVIRNANTPSSLFGDRAALVFQPLDATRMHQAAQALIGEHDFSAFRAVGCQAHHPVRCVSSVSVRRHGELVVVDISANAFLYNMVRIIVGTLMRVGLGKAPVEWVGELLQARSRLHVGATAPPQGLYFLGPSYAPEWGLPDKPRLQWLDFR